VFNAGVWWVAVRVCWMVGVAGTRQVPCDRRHGSLGDRLQEERSTN